MAKKLKLVCEVNKDVPEFLIGDGRRIASVVSNLVSNAIKFSPKPDSSITVSIKVSERSERAFWKTSILAMKCAKWPQKK